MVHVHGASGGIVETLGVEAAIVDGSLRAADLCVAELLTLAALDLGP